MKTINLQVVQAAQLVFVFGGLRQLPCARKYLCNGKFLSEIAKGNCEQWSINVRMLFVGIELNRLFYVVCFTYYLPG